MLVLSFRGGADGLSVIVPHGDPDLYTWRPGIGVPAGALLAKDSMFGLHPGLAPLVPFWNAGTFGAVHACGMAQPNRSHFEAMEEMERAAPGTSTRTGWLDRTVGLRTAGTSFQSVQMGDSLPAESLTGPNPELAMYNLSSFRIDGADDPTALAPWNAALTALHSNAGPELAAPTASALGAVATTTALASQTYTPENGAAYDENSQLAVALRDLARLIKADVGLQIACVDYGDWDMHVDLGKPDTGWMHDKMTELSAALVAFMTDLGTVRMNKVTVVTLSEFGRRVEENGSGGVDHGYGNAVLLLGGAVNGGTVHGTWPGLAENSLLDGDVAVTTDYRTVLGEILSKRCQVGDLSGVFPGMPSAPSIGVVKSG